MTDTARFQARAASLAYAAMNAVALLPAGGNSDYDRERQRHAEACGRSRADGIARGRAHNQALHVQSHIRKYGGFQDALPF